MCVFELYIVVSTKIKSIHELCASVNVMRVILIQPDYHVQYYYVFLSDIMFKFDLQVVSSFNMCIVYLCEK